MDPGAYAAAGEGSDQGEAAVSARMRDAARGWIVGRLADADKPAAVDVDADARGLARVMESRVEGLLDNGIEQLSTPAARAVWRGCEVAFAIGVRCLPLEVQYTRVYGFCVLGLPKVLAVFYLGTYLRLIRAGLAQQADNPYLHYCLGQYHSRVPMLLGGKRSLAVASLARAYDCAAAFGLDAAKFVVSYASSLARVGRDPDAMALLLRHFAADPAPNASERVRRRYDRARALAARLRARSTNVQSLTV
jgi:hypothetical protein